MRSFKITTMVLLFASQTGYVAAQTPKPLPENTINCSAFKKQSDGWYVGSATTFDFGSMKRITLSNVLVSPRFIKLAGDFDLYDVIEQKCGGKGI
jgi:hypothetical protein